MSVRNPKALAEAISNWIQKQAGIAHAKTAVFGLSGGVDSALVALLCKRVFPNAVGVNMPCHSSDSARTRAKEFADKIGLHMITVDLGKCHDLLVDRTEAQLLNLNIDFEHSNGTEGALRSCLRAPTLDYVAKKLGGIIVGTGNRDEDEFTRYYQKRGDGAVDISPIAKLHKSEVYELAKHLGCTEAILTATPTADLWGPDSGQADEKQLGLTYQEVEWAIRQFDRFGKFDDEATLNFNVSEGSFKDYSDREQHVMVTLALMEINSRHKENPNLPVFNPREIPGLLD